MFDENARVVRQVLAAFNTGDLGSIEEFISEDYHNDESMGDSEERAALRGPENFRATVAWMRRAFPDLHIEEQELISSSDMVVVRALITGTQREDFMGIPPRGKHIAARQVYIFRLEDGKICEHRAFRDDLAIMMQLGAISLVPATADSASAYD